MDHPNPANRADTALSYIPVVLSQLDADGKDMLATILQAMREGGYEDGYLDGVTSGKRVAQESARQNGRHVCS